MTRARLFIILSLVSVGLLGAFLSGFFLDSYFDVASDEFSLLDQAYNILINHAYVDLPEASILEYGMIRGLVEASGDRYASFQEPVQHELESNNLQGSFGGIGIEYSYNQDGDLLIFPISSSPASEAGIHPGDHLLMVDQLAITTQTHLDEVKAAIRGPVGESVQITVFHPDSNTTSTHEIRRESIHLPSVTWRIAPGEPGIGIMDVHIVAESTSREIEDAVVELENLGAIKYILDLRDNGGGLLTSGIDSARLFLEEGVIIQQQYSGQDTETFMARRPGPLSDLPLVILINHNTASAAEIIAGSLQSQERAALVGENSFGKDSIQLVFDLEDGSSLHVTAAKWWIPGLISPIGEGGLVPDIPVSQSEDQVDLILQTAIEHLNGK
jgi:carboxyl-terminal processing protease